MTPANAWMFQSLNRAYKRSDPRRRHTLRPAWNCFNPSIGLTSVPTMQSLSCAYFAHAVSIPQSGLQAFRPSLAANGTFNAGLFQSLNRAYKRSDASDGHVPAWGAVVFQSLNRAYKRSDPTRPIGAVYALQFQSLNRAYKRSDLLSNCCIAVSWGCFNPSIGLTSVPTPVWDCVL